MAPRPVRIEATGVDGDLVAEGLSLSRLAPNIVVKIPVVTTSGQPCFREITELSAAGVVVNATSCFSLGQVALAAKAGARFVSIFVGRIDDEGGDGARVIAACRRWVDDWKMDVTLVAASMRSPRDVQRSMVAGVHSVAVPPAVLAKLADHTVSRHAIP